MTVRPPDRRPDTAAPADEAPGVLQLPREVVSELRQTAHFGRAGRVRELVTEALQRYEDEDLEAALGPLLEAKGMAPRSAVVRELLGLVLYGLGRWREATRELATYRRLSDRRDLDHLRADCERALGRPEKALEILDGIKESHVGEETIVEAFVIAAGALRDLGRIPEAVALLERGPVQPPVVYPYHLRLWYALADALEAAGRRVEARDWWDLVYAEDPEFFDVERRRLRRA